MIILRIFLYLICVISIGWSILIFGGPPIIKRLISGYSDGAFEAIGVTVSPGLDVSISRLEFSFQNEITGQQIEGFSRATEVVWSLLGNKPFLEIYLGPSFLKDYATVDNINFYTPSIQNIDWQNIAFAANINAVAINSLAKIDALKVAGNLNLESAQVSNVNIDAEKLSAKNGSSTYSANLIRGDIRELSFNVPLHKQLFSTTFIVDDIVVYEPYVTAPEVMIELSVEEESRNFKIDLQNLSFLDVGGSIANLKVHGHLNNLNFLQELYVASADSIPFENSPKFPEILARVKRSGEERYRASVKGNVEKFELSNSDNFIGSLPDSNFVMDIELDKGISKVISTSKIDFNTSNDVKIVGNVEVGFGSELLTKLECALSGCKLSDFDLAYLLNFDDEWVRGRANCVKSFCALAELDHLLQTSNTVNIFTILNEAKILSPLSAMYLYGAISSGQKVNDGHELKFQF